MRTGTALSLKPTGQVTVSGFAGGLLAQAFLHLQAGGAGAVFLGQERAKGVLIAFAVVGQLPGFDRLQGHRQAGQVAEGALVVAIDAGTGQGLHQRPVVLAVLGGVAGGEAVDRLGLFAAVASPKPI